ncbi:hypothetical protein [Jannaschia sp. W003]|uniref:hypothetical protein n=1 Tax=Jannaschia sp. W003 TaxID=2867012 RepID=UPI0021A35683|nr:hypothetical protein [Jannaschia sp. W003]UWQ19980.1 hypothetical protein K3554_08085 [Jannaschia sp. W003]
MGSIKADDRVALRGVEVVLAASPDPIALLHVAAPGGAVRMGGCTMLSEGPTCTVVLADPGPWGAGGTGIVPTFASEGGNLCGAGIEGPAQHANPAVAPMDMDAFLGLTDAEGRDLAGF